MSQETSLSSHEAGIFVRSFLKHLNEISLGEYDEPLPLEEASEIVDQIFPK